MECGQTEFRRSWSGRIGPRRWAETARARVGTVVRRGGAAHHPAQRCGRQRGRCRSQQQVPAPPAAHRFRKARPRAEPSASNADSSMLASEVVSGAAAASAQRSASLMSALIEALGRGTLWVGGEGAQGGAGGDPVGGGEGAQRGAGGDPRAAQGRPPLLAHPPLRLLCTRHPPAWPVWDRAPQPSAARRSGPGAAPTARGTLPLQATHLREVTAQSSAAMWRSVAGCTSLCASKAATSFCSGGQGGAADPGRPRRRCWPHHARVANPASCPAGLAAWVPAGSARQECCQSPHARRHAPPAQTPWSPGPR